MKNALVNAAWATFVNFCQRWRTKVPHTSDTFTLLLQLFHMLLGTLAEANDHDGFAGICFLRRFRFILSSNLVRAFTKILIVKRGKIKVQITGQNVNSKQLFKLKVCNFDVGSRR